jgi:hypothetical protein
MSRNYFGYNGMVLKEAEFLDYKEGRINGIIDKNEAEIVKTILSGKTVVFISPYGRYMFDWDSLEWICNLGG